MKFLLNLLIILIFAVCVTPALGAPGNNPKYVINSEAPAVVTNIETVAPTIIIMGDSTAPYDGTFEVGDWHGWSSVDLTARTTSAWHIDVYNASLLDESMTPNLAMYCGEVFASCGSDDPEGYGHNYEEYLDFWTTVIDDSIATDVIISGVMNYDMEPGYDALELWYETSDQWYMVTSWTGNNIVDGVPVPVTFSEMAPYGDYKYLGPSSDEIHLRFIARSDDSGDDQDCAWPTTGLAQIDNLVVSGGTNMTMTMDDFESGFSDNWTVAFPQGVGDFAKIWCGLSGESHCGSNSTCQVAFIDDGLVEDCGGDVQLGTLGISWVYGPGGFTTNLQGGCEGPDSHLHNEIWSPEMDWPAGVGYGAELSFDCYRHLPLENGLFYVWHVRARTGPGQWTDWADDGCLYYGGPSYEECVFDVTPHLDPLMDKVQVALGVYELGWIWGFEGIDATPAPYFDNVVLKAFDVSGPVITTRIADLFQSGFPAIGEISTTPGENDIRLDSGIDVSDPEDPDIVTGNTAEFTIKAVNPGKVLDLNSIEMHFRIAVNPQTPMADRGALSSASYLTSVIGPGGVSWDIYEGVVLGASVTTEFGVVPDRYCFDPPDTEFLYPGDVMHYYISARVDMDTPQTLPSDLTGYGDFTAIHAMDFYNPYFIVRGLPTITGDKIPNQTILLWIESPSGSQENEWRFALAQNGYRNFSYPLDYDILFTPATSMGLSSMNATHQTLDWYGLIIYSAGSESRFTLLDSDLALLDGWLKLEDKSIIATGDNILTDIDRPGWGMLFTTTWLQVSYIRSSVFNPINQQYSPYVKRPTWSLLPRDFMAYGACPEHDFDHVSLMGATAMAYFTAEDDMNCGGVQLITVPAVFRATESTYSSKIWFSVVDFGMWYTPACWIDDGNGDLSARAENLAVMLADCGYKSIPTAAPQAPPVFFARSFPNPFNPVTTIEFSVPKAGPVTIKIFNVRGELVRTLVDQNFEVTALETREWNGRDDQGQAVASGVYFCETIVPGDAKVQKMALVR